MSGSAFIDYDVTRLTDGSVAVLGGLGTISADSGAAGRLVDVFYGWYNPADMVMHQVYLFAGDGTMTEYAGGMVGERQYLFSADGADYFLRTPETALEFELIDGKLESLLFPYARLELIKIEGDESFVLDPLVTRNRKIVLAEDRIIYNGAESSDHLSFESPSLVGIRMDGSDRRTVGPAYSVSNNLSYDNGYLYFEGLVNASAFSRPIYRMKPDFSEITKLGDFNGSLISVVEGTFYMLSGEKTAIVLTRENHFDEIMYYDKCGYDAKNYDCDVATVSDGKLMIRFGTTSGKREIADYEIPLAEDGWWE